MSDPLAWMNNMLGTGSNTPVRATASLPSKPVGPLASQIVTANVSVTVFAACSIVSVADITGQSQTYAANGPFTITATTHFLVNGQDAAVTSATCQQPVSFTTAPTPPVTPPATLGCLSHAG